MVKKDLQKFYYNSLAGKLLGSLAREKEVDALIDSINGESILDVGCAEGHYLKKLIGKFNKIVGIEYEQQRVKDARKILPTAKIVQGSAEKLPFKDNEFDLVLCSEVLEHVPDWKKALSELQRVSRKNILITIPLEKGFWWRLFSIVAPMSTREHLHRINSEDILQELNGFKLKEKRLITLPSRTLNHFIGNSFGEVFSFYSVLLLEKN